MGNVIGCQAEAAEPNIIKSQKPSAAAGGFFETVLPGPWLLNASQTFRKLTEMLRITDWSLVLYTLMLGWFFVMLGLPLLAWLVFLVMELLKDPSGAAVLVELKPKNLAPMLLCVVLFIPVFLGMRHFWRQNAFFVVEKSGDWVFRNFCYLTRVRIAAGQLRQVEGIFERSLDDNNRDYIYTGKIVVTPEEQAPIEFAHDSDPLPDGRPALYQRLGYPADMPFGKGPAGGQLTPLHCWSASGPVFIAEQPEKK